MNSVRIAIISNRDYELPIILFQKRKNTCKKRQQFTIIPMMMTL